MILGVVIGVFAPGVQDTFDTVKLNGVSARMYLNYLYDLSHTSRPLQLSPLD